MITSAELNPDTVSCTPRSKLDLEVLNLGSDLEDEVRVTVTNSDLNLDYDSQDDEGDIELEEGVDDSKWSNSISINAANAKEGQYPIEINVYRSRTRLEQTKTVILTVAKCVPTTTTTEDNEEQTTTEEGSNEPVDVVVVPPKGTTTTEGEFPVIAQPVSEPFTESTGYTVFLVVAVLILLILVVMVIVLLAKKK